MHKLAVQTQSYNIMLKAVIIEDEARARNILRQLLEEYCPDVTCVAMADDVPSGVKAIYQHQPDIVFLDIEMPGQSGFQLFDFFDEISFEVVFTTAYDQYALKAFEVSAIGYLLKPIQIDQLIQTVLRIKKMKDTAPIAERVQTLKMNINSPKGINRIALPSSEGLLFVETDEVIYLSAEGAYTTVVLTGGRKLVVSKNLKQLTDVLVNDCFFRAHRSFLLNLNHVRQYVRQDGGYVIMDTDKKIPLSTNKRKEFLEVYQIK